MNSLSTDLHRKSWEEGKKNHFDEIQVSRICTQNYSRLKAVLHKIRGVSLKRRKETSGIARLYALMEWARPRVEKGGEQHGVIKRYQQEVKTDLAPGLLGSPPQGNRRGNNRE